jgi:beta-lactamase regulating signal transducer with metallopeptidase domain
VIAAAGLPFLAPADSARAVTTVYTMSLLAIVPTVLAASAAFALRRSSAEGRTLVWRAAIVALLLLFLGRQLPVHWVAWVVPASIAAPIVALGRLQVTTGGVRISDAAFDAAAANTAVDLLLAAYVIGVLLVLLPTLVARRRIHSMVRRSRPLRGSWTESLEQCSAELGVGRGVRLVVSDEVSVPMTCGVVRPVVLVPRTGLGWSSEERRMVLIHELAHVRSGDALFKLLARLVCALFWFHPGVWWIARGMREDCELACDDRVIASGARRSDYAELLIGASDALLAPEPALALSRGRGLRARLAAVLDPRHDVRPLRRAWLVPAACGALIVAAPLSAVQLTPSREVLTTLMRDASWESRAYAVIGLAARADSVAVARSAAERDPNPRVRAWARYALGELDSK